MPQLSAERRIFLEQTRAELRVWPGSLTLHLVDFQVGSELALNGGFDQHHLAFLHHLGVSVTPGIAIRVKSLAGYIMQHRG